MFLRQVGVVVTREGGCSSKVVCEVWQMRTIQVGRKHEDGVVTISPCSQFSMNANCQPQQSTLHELCQPQQSTLHERQLSTLYIE